MIKNLRILLVATLLFIGLIDVKPQGANNSLFFDGDNIITIPTTGINANQGTIEMWVRSNWTYPGGSYLSYYMWFDMELPRLNLYFKNADLRTHWWAQGDNIIADVAWQANRWYHYAATYDFVNDVYNFYRNGQLIGTSTATRSTAALSTSAKIGSRFNGAYPWHGQIDEVRIWSDVRTQAEIQEWMNKNTGITDEPNLEYFFKFDETSVGSYSVIDSANGYNGNPSGMNNSDVRTSTAPIGDQSHYGSGTSNLLENSSVPVDIYWSSGGDAGSSATFSAIQVNYLPKITTGLPLYYSDVYWEFWVQDHDGSYSNDFVIHFDSVGGIDDETSIGLFYRSDVASSWSEYPTYSIDNEGDDHDGIGTITALGLSSEAQFIIGSVNPDNSSLPVSLVEFDLKCDVSEPKLFWQTTSEKNNLYFEVYGSNDGENYKFIGRISGNLNSNILTNYEFNILNDYELAYYQLRQTDVNGVQKIIGNIHNKCHNNDNREFEISCDENYIMVYMENPFNSISIIELADIQGKILFSSEMLSNQNYFQIPISNLGFGVYNISILSQGTKTKKQVIIAK